MAQAPLTFEYTFTAGLSSALSDIMGVRQKTWIMTIAARASRSNANDISWNVDGMGQGGFIGPGEAVVFDFAPDGTLVGTFHFNGAANDKMFLTIGINSDYIDQTHLT